MKNLMNFGSILSLIAITSTGCRTTSSDSNSEIAADASGIAAPLPTQLFDQDFVDMLNGIAACGKEAQEALKGSDGVDSFKIEQDLNVPSDVFVKNYTIVTGFQLASEPTFIRQPHKTLKITASTAGPVPNGVLPVTAYKCSVKKAVQADLNENVNNDGLIYLNGVSACPKEFFDVASKGDKITLASATGSVANAIFTMNESKLTARPDGGITKEPVAFLQVIKTLQREARPGFPASFKYECKSGRVIRRL